VNEQQQVDVARIRRRLDRAQELVGNLAAGTQRWKMSIPADPERDSDLILTAALDGAEQLLDLVDRFAAELATTANMLCTAARKLHPELDDPNSDASRKQAASRERIRARNERIRAEAAAERQLLREVIAWARAHGWEHGYIKPSDEHVWVHTPRHGQTRCNVQLGWSEDTRDKRTLDIDWGESLIEVDTIREAVDVLVALGVLPAEHSTAYTAGVSEGLGMAEALEEDVIDRRVAYDLDAILARLNDDEQRRVLGEQLDNLCEPPILPQEPYARRRALEAIVEAVGELLGADDAS
jgi:hypothetical protein